MSKPPSKSNHHLRYLPLTVALVIMCGCVSRETRNPDNAFHIFKDGKPMASIMVDESAIPPPEQRFCDHTMERIPEQVPSDITKAVDLFRRDVRMGYGVDLPMGPDANVPNSIEIVVEKRSLMKEDETTIDFPASNVMRVTGGESGVIRTLFYLLEEFGGARYLFQGAPNDIGIGAHFPKRTTLAIPREPIKRSSAFPLNRSTGQTTYGANWPDARNRVYWWSWEARLGTKSRVAFSHYLTKVAFPIDRYMRSEEKPNEEMFPIHQGKRVKPWEWGADLDASYCSRNYRGKWQPRFSSQAAVDEASKNLLAYLRENPGVRSLTLAVNDCGGHCETEIDPNHPVLDNPKLVESYYKWVNAVAERVTAEFPDVHFGVIAYREVERPPNFKLHPNVVVYLCFDTQECIDPEMREKREKLIRDWSKVATIGSYSYDYGDTYYSLPRLYTRETQDMIQFYRDHGALAALSERVFNTATEGPKMYVLLKLLENPDLDVDATILDWCEAAVGPDAAPHLRDYYAFWEDFWRDKAIHTKWWKSSKDAVYLTLGKFGSYMFALDPGDMARCRKLMEEVLKLAETSGTEDQRRRARLLMAGFEWYEACATACGAEYFNADGQLPNAATAVALLRDVPKAAKALRKARTLPMEMKAEWPVAKFTAAMGDPVPGSLVAAQEWLSDPKVQKEFKAISENTELDASLRLLANAMLTSVKGGDGANNLLANGSFESPKAAVDPGKVADYRRRGVEGWQTWAPIHGSVSRSNEQSASGDHSLKCDIAHGNFRAIRIVKNARPDTQYYLCAKVYVPEDQPVQEGRVKILGNPTTSGPQGYNSHGKTKNIQTIIPKAGEWNYVSCVIPGHRKTDSLRLRIDLSGFEPGDVAYIDDVQVLELAVPETTEGTVNK